MEDVKKNGKESQLDSVNVFNDGKEEIGWWKRKKRQTLDMSRYMKKLFEIFLTHLAWEKKKSEGEFADLSPIGGIKGSRPLFY